MGIIHVLRLLTDTTTPAKSWTSTITKYMHYNTFNVAHSSGADCCPEASYNLKIVEERLYSPLNPAALLTTKARETVAASSQSRLRTGM